MAGRRTLRGPRPVPTEAELEEAALDYLARYAAPAAAVARVLERRLLKAARTLPDQEAAARALAAGRVQVGAVLSRLIARGLIDDAAYAATRTGRLRREGRSRRAIAARLLARGVGADEVAGALLAEAGAAADAPAPGQGGEGAQPGAALDPELAAACAFARRRRLGPFAPARRGETDAADGPEARAAVRQRALAAFARAGFGREVARRVLAMAPAAAEALVAALRRG